jgi:hypothetical protein
MAVQFEFAGTEAGEIVHASVAKKGVRYFCANPICNGEMILKKGEIREHHFAHKHKDYDHEGESLLHYNLKILLFGYIKSFADDKNPLYLLNQFSPAESQKINILDDVDGVFVEKNATLKYRPDISLHSRNKFIMAVEIVVTHDLEPEAESYLKENLIPCIKVAASNELYTLLLERYLKQDPDFLLMPNEAELLKFDSMKRNEWNISISDDADPVDLKNTKYQENEGDTSCDFEPIDLGKFNEYENITVTYFPDIGNIFPCYGFSPCNTEDEFGGVYISGVGGPFRGFRERIMDAKIPCEDCFFYHSRPEQNKIICKNPLAKLDQFKKHDEYITPVIFIFDKYYKSGKKHREQLVKEDALKEIYRLRNSMEFFEYDTKTYEFAFSGKQYMKVYDEKSGQWRAPNKAEILMKETYFYCGKYIGKTIEEVFKADKSYLRWILKTQPSRDLKNVLDVVNEMRKNKMI